MSLRPRCSVKFVVPLLCWPVRLVRGDEAGFLAMAGWAGRLPMGRSEIKSAKHSLISTGSVCKVPLSDLS